MTKDGNPNAGTTYDLGDNFPTPVDQREIVDQSFLGLVLFGVKPHDDPVVRNSLAVGDDVLRAETPHGPMWHRFTSDGYGETESGADWDIFDRRRARRSGACGRSCRASAASTTCSPAVTRGPRCAPSPVRPTRG